MSREAVARRAAGWVALAAWIGSSAAFAQASPPPADVSPASPAAPAPVAGVTVTARTPDTRTLIDRHSYSLADDLQRRSGSLADVLGHVPSVQVDGEGAVSLRGDPNVTILIDGKPSSLFSGPGRAQALRSMSADRFDRVEVMTNPSAAQIADGGGGVINLITRKAPSHAAAPTGSGTVSADVGSGDRYDLGASGAYSAPGLSLTGGGDLRRSAYRRDIDTRYRLSDPATGASAPAEQTQRQDERDDVATLYATADYDLDAHDHLTAGFNALDLRIVQPQVRTYDSAASAGPLALDFTAPGHLHSHFLSTSKTIGLTRTSGEETLSGVLSLSQSNIDAQTVAAYRFTKPSLSALHQDLTQTAGFPQLDFKIEDVDPLPDKSKLTFGYELKIDWQGEGNRGDQGAAADVAAIDPAFGQRFTFEQRVHAVYATYERAFGRLTVQPGLRLEATTVDTDLVSASQKATQAYVEAYPSLHLSQQIDDDRQFNASFGRRVLRPDESQLDPFRIYNSPTLYTAGDPRLRPTFIESYEAGYEFSKKTTDLQATLFYRSSSNLISPFSQDLGGGVLLTTFQNLGRGRDAGLELVVKRELLRGVSLSASTDLMHSAIETSGAGAVNSRATFAAAGQATLNWRVTSRDFVQFGGQATGRQLTAQGYQGGVLTSNLGWRHRFDDRLASTFTVTDPFGLVRRASVIDAPGLFEVERRKSDAVAVFFGLSYAFSGARKQIADNFDVGSQPRDKP